ncbi:MAG: c-type cytochrome [Betaproteobacteria bacterium]|nr:c-type cytochrome [Betaproteobacteria bacterium]
MRRLLCLFVCLVSCCVQAQGLTNPLSPDPEVVAHGRKLFHRTGCIACHGTNARGAVGPDLTDDEWLRAPSDEMIFNTIRNGRSGTVMSGFAGDLSEEETWTIITWLRDENRKRKAP